MKAKRIAEITANIVDLKKQVSILSDELNKEHGVPTAAALIAKAIIAREVAKIAMLDAELSAVIQAPEKKNRKVATARQAYPELKKLCDHLGIDISEAVSLSIHFNLKDGITYDLNAYATVADEPASNADSN